jgi:hypothetical protein
MSKPSDQPGRDLWREYFERRQPTAPPEDPPYPEAPPVYGGPDPSGADERELADAERIIHHWPAGEQNLAVGLAWVRGWRPRYPGDTP